MTEEMGLQTFP